MYFTSKKKQKNKKQIMGLRSITNYWKNKNKKQKQRKWINKQTITAIITINQTKSPSSLYLVTDDTLFFFFGYDVYIMYT